MGKLLRHARRLVRIMGHTPGTTHRYTPTWAGISCERCGREVQILDTGELRGYALSIRCD